VSETAEQALAALARDLVEEIAAGRAMELAGDFDELDLADHQRDLLELVNWVKPFQRVREGRPEQVHGYQEQRKPGLGTGLEANELGKQGGWIPEADWLKGEQEWKAKGEAAWKKHEWKGQRKPKTTQDVSSGIRDTRSQLPKASQFQEMSGRAYPGFAWDKAHGHLNEAQKHLSERGSQHGQIDQDKVGKAYHELGQAHQHIVSHVVPHAQPEQYPEIAQHLQRIAGHMQDLDQAMGANPQSTRKLLGTGKEVMAHAGEARREQKQKQLENEHADFQPGHEVQEVKTGRTGTIVSSGGGNRPGMGHNVWYVHFPGATSDPPFLGSELVPTGAGDIAQQVSKAQFEAQWAGKRVQIGQDKGTVVDAAPKEIWDQGAEEFLPPDPGVVMVRWDKTGKPPTSREVARAEPGVPNPVHVSALTLEQPPPKTGAAAVHPNLGGHLAKQPGDTISGHGLGHVPQPFQAQPLDVSDQAALQAQQEAMAASKQQEQELRQQTQQALREEKLQNAALERQGISPPGIYAPLTDSQFAVHTRNVEKALTAAYNAGMATDEAYTLDGKGQAWEPDRSIAHGEIVREFLDKQVSVPSSRHAVLLGGLPGAGKSSLLKQLPGVSPGDYAVISADNFKAELARRGMVPKVQGLSPMEASPLIHEESVHLANLAAAALRRRGKNLAFEVTMNRRDRTQAIVSRLKKDGYGVTAVFADVPVDVSANRVASRYRRSLEAYRQGTDPLGGRYVSQYDIAAGESERGVTGARQTFDAMRPQFAAWQLWDGSKGTATLAEKSGPPEPPGGIPSVEELQKAAAGKASAMRVSRGYVGNTEKEARAAEKGMAGD
jgi:predicted kinase